MQSIPTLKEFLNDEKQEVRETWEYFGAETTNFQEGNPWVYQYTVTTSYLWIYLFFADSSHLKIWHRPCLRRSFDCRPVLARLTQTQTFRLLLKPSSIRFFPCSSDTGQLFTCVISALRPRSTALSSACSRRMKSALPSLKHAVALSYGQLSGPHSVLACQDP